VSLSVVVLQLFSLLQLLGVIDSYPDSASGDTAASSSSSSSSNGWTGAVKSVFTTLRVFVMDSAALASGGCAMPLSHYDWLVMAAVLPLAVLVLCGFLYRQSTAVYRRLFVLRLGVLLLILLYPWSSVVAFRSFRCSSFGPLYSSYLQADLNLQCFTPAYYGFATLAAIVLAAYAVGFPVTLLYAVLRPRAVREQLHRTTSQSALHFASRQHRLSGIGSAVSPQQRQPQRAEIELHSPEAAEMRFRTGSVSFAAVNSVETLRSSVDANDPAAAGILVAATAAAAAHRYDDSEFRIGVGVLSDQYRPVCVWWDSVELLRKLLTSAVAILPFPWPDVTGFIGATAACLLLLAYRPYRRQLYNRTQLVCYGCVLVVLWLRLAIEAAANESGAAAAAVDTSTESSASTSRAVLSVLVLNRLMKEANEFIASLSQQRERDRH
jgi:hypothetical protein